MATLAKQPISDNQKEMLEQMASKAGNSIASIVRDILQDKYNQVNSEAIAHAKGFIPRSQFTAEEIEEFSRIGPKA